MRIRVRDRLFALLFAALLAASAGCRAQQPPAGTQLSPELARRVEVLIRARTKLPPDYTLNFSPRLKSEVAGFDKIEVTFSKKDEGASKPIEFLVSTDGKTVAQFNKYDISKDPRLTVSGAGRPARGGPENAPVEIVAFDDLECPYCTRMHAQLFPALTERYGDKVRIVYRDFPLVQLHPWAMRAAIDTNCIAAQSGPAYWSLVDYIHAHAAELGGQEKSLAKANESLDALTLSEAKKDKLSVEPVEACVKKQDDSAIKASMKVGDDLGIEATPVLYINGEKLEGAYPIADVFHRIDVALIAAGVTPPPPYAPPAPPAASAPKATPSATPSVKSSN